MIAFKCILRNFHSTSIYYAALEKSALATLRKSTGYTFTNCKKALELHNNDLTKAEQWLKEQAQALGWTKATKLEGRQTSQGLIGVLVDKNDGVLVEVNCETDFVARNDEFQNMVTLAAETCMNFTKTELPNQNTLRKMQLNTEPLKSLKTTDGSTLADQLALMIGKLGENATLKRALCFKVNENDNIHLSGYAHPSGKISNNVLLGRVGGLVALKSILTSSNLEDNNINEVGTQLCQHIVGMAPKLIGDINNEPTKTNNNEDETALLYQEFLLDNELIVKDVLEDNQIDIIDFHRFECGETSNTTDTENADNIQQTLKLETC